MNYPTWKPGLFALLAFVLLSCDPRPQQPIDPPTDEVGAEEGVEKSAEESAESTITALQSWEFSSSTSGGIAGFSFHSSVSSNGDATTRNRGQQCTTPVDPGIIQRLGEIALGLDEGIADDQADSDLPRCTDVMARTVILQRTLLDGTEETLTLFREVTCEPTRSLPVAEEVSALIGKAVCDPAETAESSEPARTDAE
ncbi:MAG TPA: hypothetical protein VM534_06880 [Thermoanaerobaculia bacterium]|nr:hypothetical protein [Thermoanaerobaculia bacterium]